MRIRSGKTARERHGMARHGITAHMTRDAPAVVAMSTTEPSARMQRKGYSEPVRKTPATMTHDPNADRRTACASVTCSLMSRISGLVPSSSSSAASASSASACKAAAVAAAADASSAAEAVVTTIALGALATRLVGLPMPRGSKPLDGSTSGVGGAYGRGDSAEGSCCGALILERLGVAAAADARSTRADDRGKAPPPAVGVEGDPDDGDAEGPDARLLSMGDGGE